MDINQIKIDNKFKLVEASAGTGKSFTFGSHSFKKCFGEKS